MFVQPDGVEWKVFFFTAAGVGVDLQLDQFGHGVHTIAHHAGGFTFVGSCHMVADHQESVFLAQNEALHNDFAAFGQCNVVSGGNVFLFGELQRYASGMVAIGRFDTHRQADVLSSFPSGHGAVHDLAFRHRHATHAEQLLGQVFVFGNAFSNGASAVGFGCPDPALLGAVSQLHQVAIVQADGWNAAVAGGIHDAGCAGPNAQAVHHLFESIDFDINIKSTTFNGRQNQVSCGFEGAATDGFMAGANHDFVNTAWTGFSGFAKAGLHARLGLQFQRHMFQHMSSPSALFQSLQKSTTLTHAAAVLHQTWQPSGQALIETWKGVGGKVF